MTKNLLAAAVLLLASSSCFASGWNTYVVKSQDEWKKICETFPEIPAPDEPRADFSKDMLVLVVGAEQSRAGHKVKLVLHQDPIDSARLTVFYRDIPPARSSFNATVMTRAYAYHRVPRSYTKVAFEADRPLHTQTGQRFERWSAETQAFGR